MAGIIHSVQEMVKPPKAPTYEDLKASQFPWHTGCNLTLYQDAHCGEDSPVQHLSAAEGEAWLGPRSCWEDIYSAILNARYFVFITGWSVMTNITMLRGGREIWPSDPMLPPPPSGAMTIGELLKYKASHGCQVVVHVWNDATSVDAMGVTVAAGIMHTGDEETSNYFKDSNVVVKLSYREGEGVGSRFEWTHHQKSVILDVPSAFPNVRRVTAFVGGLDLTGGRFDSPRHSLFRTLGTLHLNDWYQGWGDEIKQEFGPRQPWHDIHSWVEGAAAWDVLANFQQRWAKQGLHHVHLFQPAEPLFLPPQGDLAYPPGHPSEWHLRFVRSIDSNSALSIFDSKEQGIQKAYVEMIRNAQRFIYIENQYFMGSCYYWRQHRESGCKQLVPYEIASRIATSILAHAPVTAYIVVPMYPEGYPEDGAIQEMLRWQWNTMEMMYTMIAGAINQAGWRGLVHPTDFLSFFCLGNRETVVGSTAANPGLPTDPKNLRVVQSRRFYVYVHAKLMIVDDDHVILGSANLNERSQRGTRDTEIAIQGFQPAYRGAAARGRIHHFRSSLWAEHTGLSMPEFLMPEHLNCVRLMRAIGESNAAAFYGDQIVDIPGHLLAYPIAVAEDGTLTPNPQLFADTQAPIQGAAQFAIPTRITS